MPLQPVLGLVVSSAEDSDLVVATLTACVDVVLVRAECENPTRPHRQQV